MKMREMKKYKINITYVGDDNTSVVVKFMKLVDSIQGATIDSLSVENAKDEEIVMPPFVIDKK